MSSGAPTLGGRSSRPSPTQCWFWPERGGPRWDALALVSVPGGPNAGVLLAEGKSHLDEMLKGTRAKATDPSSIRAIEKALAWTQGMLGVPLDTDAWSGPLG